MMRFKQKTAYEITLGDWSSDVCSSDLCDAQWPIRHKKAQHKKFSITKYGEEEAYLRAFTARATALKVLSTQTFSPFESWILRRKKAG